MMRLTKQELRALIKRNPDLKLPAELMDAQALTPLPAAGSPLEERFLQIWRSLDGPELVREYRFDETRKWRVDFLHLASRVIIECEGIGRHNRIKGFRDDAEKYLSATLQGYTVVRLPSNLITPEWVGKVLEFVRSKEHAD